MPNIIEKHLKPACVHCRGPGHPQCGCEAQSLFKAVEQATQRWQGLEDIRNWVINQSRTQVLAHFEHLKSLRYERIMQALSYEPCFALYRTWHGQPPMEAPELARLESTILHARMTYREGVNADWHAALWRYPEILEFFFGLVEIGFPDDRMVRRLLKDSRMGAVMRLRSRTRSRSRSRHSDRSSGRRRREQRLRSRDNRSPRR